MLDKLKNIFNNKEKRIENLISFLIILVITLIVINKILKEDDKKSKNYQNEIGVQLATETISKDTKNDELEKKLETILGKIDGVGKVSVLLIEKHKCIQKDDFNEIYEKKLNLGLER